LPDEIEAVLGTNPLLTDSDGNGTADGDEDADRDRQSNFAESILTLTDPLDPNSRFTFAIARPLGIPDRIVLTFPTLTGRTYSIERSHNLSSWSLRSSLPGDGTMKALPVAGDSLESANLFRVVVRMP
jgi:hypothetical protein